LDRALQTVASAKPADLQAVAASQIRLLDVYHDIGLNQARYSFRCALGGAGVGLIFFILASIFALLSSNTVVALIPVIGGVSVEVLAGFMFVLYGRTIVQLDAFYQRLNTLQPTTLSRCQQHVRGADERGEGEGADRADPADDTAFPRERVKYSRFSPTCSEPDVAAEDQDGRGASGLACSAIRAACHDLSCRHRSADMNPAMRLRSTDRHCDGPHAAR